MVDLVPERDLKLDGGRAFGSQLVLERLNVSREIGRPLSPVPDLLVTIREAIDEQFRVVDERCLVLLKFANSGVKDPQLGERFVALGRERLQIVERAIAERQSAERGFYQNLELGAPVSKRASRATSAGNGALEFGLVIECAGQPFLVAVQSCESPEITHDVAEHRKVSRPRRGGLTQRERTARDEQSPAHNSSRVRRGTSVLEVNGR